MGGGHFITRCPPFAFPKDPLNAIGCILSLILRQLNKGTTLQCIAQYKTYLSIIPKKTHPMES